MDEKQVQHVSEIQAKYADMLMRKANVIGVGIGQPKEDDCVCEGLALIVMVERKMPLEELDPEDVLPVKIDGVRVDVQAVGTIQTF